MLRAKQILPLLGMAAALLVTPALATNDPTVPADECSGNPNAVGQPQSHGGINAVDIGPSPVQGPASLNNPSANSPTGGSDGAKASEHQKATTRCKP